VSASVVFSFPFSAVCCAVDTGFAVSAVLSTFPNPTSHLARVILELNAFPATVLEVGT
jgi:hypothetical protein